MHHLAFIRKLIQEYENTTDREDRENLCKEMVDHLNEMDGGHCDECRRSLPDKQEFASPWCSVFYRSMPPHGYCHEFKHQEIPEEVRN